MSLYPDTAWALSFMPRRSQGTREEGEQAEEMTGCLPGSRQDRTQPFIQEERRANGDGKTVAAGLMVESLSLVRGKWVSFSFKVNVQ